MEEVRTFRLAVAEADGEIRTKALKLPDIVADWVGGVDKKRILDFGCGNGLTAAGIAMGHRPTLVHGVDINNEAAECLPLLRSAVGTTRLPANLSFEEIEPGSVGHVSDLDVVYAWSVFEHVARNIVDDVVVQLRDRLRPGGHVFVQISPLYFSPEGSHLWALGYSRWEHLLKQVSEIRNEIDQAIDIEEKTKDALWSMFESLNRITAEELVQEFLEAGFKLLRQQRDQTELDPPQSLKSTYVLEVLKTFQIAALFVKP